MAGLVENCGAIARLFGCAACPIWLLVASCLTLPLSAQDSGEVAALRAALELQRAAIAEQREQLERQQADLERQAAQLEALAARLEQATDAAPAVRAMAVSPATSNPTRTRDAVGDLNAKAVAAGSFPGSIRIPGTHDLSLAIGGFVKLVGTADSNLEGTGATFLPAYIGAARPDTAGGTSFDASLTRIEIDALAPTPNGSLRGYIEWDLNGSNNGSLGVNLRHAYGRWQTGGGTLTAGHTWSTAMDLKILPEGLTEPTVSGAIFQRQPILRWSQSISDVFEYDIALEDSTSSDAMVGDGWRGTTRLPDLIGALEWDWGNAGHFRVTGLVRQIRVTNEMDRSTTATAWGVSTGAHLGLGENDKICLSLSVGEGAGRYLLGLPGGQAGFLDVSSGDLKLLRAAGGFVTYRHAWSDTLRSTAAFGQAWVADVDWQAADAFDSSTFGLVNLMWSPLDYITLGTEIQYGKRETKDGASRDNTRWIVGIQLF